ncbi:hypothetical protein L6R50_25530 [Myxococcota bacterium]|nr:hypothetical protein [Myxococcota bacterium]
MQQGAWRFVGLAPLPDGTAAVAVVQAAAGPSGATPRSLGGQWSDEGSRTHFAFDMAVEQELTALAVAPDGHRYATSVRGTLWTYAPGTWSELDSPLGQSLHAVWAPAWGVV